MGQALPCRCAPRVVALPDIRADAWTEGGGWRRGDGDITAEAAWRVCCASSVSAALGVASARAYLGLLTAAGQEEVRWVGLPDPASVRPSMR